MSGPDEPRPAPDDDAPPETTLPGTPYDQNPSGGLPGTPYSADPYDRNRYDADSYGPGRYSADQYGADQYGSGPYGADPFGHQFGADPFGVFPPAAPLHLAPRQPELGTAFRWAWTRFKADAGVLVGAAALWAAIVLGVILVVSVIVGAVVVALVGADLDPTDTDLALPFAGIVATTIVMIVVMSVLMGTAVSCWMGGILAIADGEQVDLGHFFRPIAFGPIMAVTVIVTVSSGASDLFFSEFLGLPWISTAVSLVISFFTVWMVYFAADVRAPVGDSLTHGMNLSTGNAGPTIVVLLISSLIVLAGMLALLVGLLVALPVSGLLMVYYFRALTRRPLAR
ncbi:MAG: hypothetical protein QM809_17815 [Gordonia sp. (in: high G+C Gram-positive bacteria)]|uniref:hypothetical protein n=1 Tax=Gordonia sp. (in: high G+C Gram-positive bacteria) TaxID=84139 RepID=UPI0039E4DD71